MLGGAVGDALGSGVRNHTTGDIQQWFGQQGVRDYLAPFGRRGAGTDLTQLTVFTLEGLLRGKAANPDPAGWLPTQIVGTNHLRWLYTQGVPWEYAMSSHLQTQPGPSGWLLECSELFSTRSPAGAPLFAMGRMATLPPPGVAGNETPMGVASFLDCLVWAAPTMVWSANDELVYSAGAAVANMMTWDHVTIGAAGLHADVLGQLMRGGAFWDSVRASDRHRLGRAYGPGMPTPADVTRTVNAAMFASHDGRRPGPSRLDVDFDTAGKPGVLGIALASVASTTTFADAVLMAVNQTADSSVTGALAGQLAGALYGWEAIPQRWRDELELREIIDVLCDDATEAFAPPPVPRWAQRYVGDASRAFEEPLQLTRSQPVTSTVDDRGPQETYLVNSERVWSRPSQPPVEPAPDTEVSPVEATTILPITDFGTDSTPVPAEQVYPPEETGSTRFLPADAEGGSAVYGPGDVGLGTARQGDETPRDERRDAPGAITLGEVASPPPAPRDSGLADSGPIDPGLTEVEPTEVDPVDTGAADGRLLGSSSERLGTESDFRHAPVQSPQAHFSQDDRGPAPRGDAASGSIGREPLEAFEGGAGDQRQAEVDRSDGRHTEIPHADWSGADLVDPDPNPSGPGQPDPTSAIPAVSGSVDDGSPVAKPSAGQGSGDRFEVSRVATGEPGPADRVPTDIPAVADPTPSERAFVEPDPVEDAGADFEPVDLAADSRLLDNGSGAQDGPEPSSPAGLVAPEPSEPSVDSEGSEGDLFVADEESPDAATVTEATVHSEPGREADHADPQAEPTAALDEADTSVAPIATGGHRVVEDVDEVAPSLPERVLGCFLGGALGDALGSDLEYDTVDQILAKVGPTGPTALREAYGVHGAITDDTQLTMFTAEGLVRGRIAVRMLGNDDPIPEVQFAYQRWWYSQGVDWSSAAGVFLGDHAEPDGWLIRVPGLFSTRSPDQTVARALADFGAGGAAGSVTNRINDSQGCGGVLRAAPFGLWSSDPAEVFALAVRGAALTHGHPSGYLSAGAFAVIVQQALLGRGIDDGVWLALQVLETWEGHEPTSKALAIAVDLAEQGVPTPEQMAETLGAGWDGPAALAIAVCATLAAGEDVESALRIAVHHGGNSDTTGAICGNIVGALMGIGALPVDWLADLELRDVVEQVAMDCLVEFGRTEPDTSAGPDADGSWSAGSESGEPIVDEDWNDRYPVRPLWSVQADSEPAESPTRLLPAISSEQSAAFTDADRRDAEPSSDQDLPSPADEVAREDRLPTEQLSRSERGAAIARVTDQRRAPDDGDGASSAGDRSEDEAAPSDADDPPQEPERKAPADQGTKRIRRSAAAEFFGSDSHPPKPAPRRINGVSPRSTDR
jgi:ADP-ribosylglycohydrolase